MSHGCHATGCKAPVPPVMWGCKRHWFMVPVSIRMRILRTYRPGQCEDWEPSKEYLEAARDAVIAVAAQEGLQPDTRLYDFFLERRGGIPCAMNERLLQFFKYDHLPENLQAVSKKFAELAQHIVETLPSNAERTVALRKLMEAKDCAVRAVIFVP
jgi:hypothetical protein